MYRKLREKIKIFRSDNDYQNQIENWLYIMFDYDKRIYRPELLEYLLHHAGCCALIRTETSDYTPVVVNFAGGERYADGYFKNVICIDGIGNEYPFTDWQKNPEICVIFNNFTRCHDSWIEKYAYFLTEIDTSIDCNVFFSRLKRIPIADDQTTKNQIDVILDDLSNGKMKTILKTPSIRSIAGNESPIDILDLTDVSKSQYIQYLSHLYDSIRSRIYETIGVGYADGAKQAQISIDELERNKSAEFLNPTVWYQSRKKGFDDFEKKSGIHLHFDFSDLWKQKQKIMKEGESNGIGNLSYGNNTESNTGDT